MTPPLFWYGVLAGGAAAVVLMALLWWWVDRRTRPTDAVPIARPADRGFPTVAPVLVGPERSTPTEVGAADAGEPTAPEETPGVEPVDSEAKERLKISYRIVLHIARQGRFGPHDVVPDSVTQAGMLEALHVGRGALSNALRRLSDGGVLEVRTGHVQGQPRRLKVYQLTSEGEQLVRELRRRFRGGANSET